MLRMAEPSGDGSNVIESSGNVSGPSGDGTGSSGDVKGPDQNKIISALAGAWKGISKVAAPLTKLSTYQAFLKQFGSELVIFPIIFAVLMWYFIFNFNKVNRTLARMIPLEEKIVGLTSLSRCPQVMAANKDFRLCDFWIASSFKTYLVQGYREEVHVNIIKQTLKLGCRFIDLDLYAETDKKGNVNIVIANGDPFNKLIYSHRMSFDDTMKTLSESAFHPRLKNGDDPLFLNLNMDALRDDDEAQEKVAQIIRNHFGAVLLDEKYNYQGRMTTPTNNVAIMPIKDLLIRKSCVIMTSTDVRDRPMDILVNLCSTTMANLAYKSYSDILGISLDDIKRINKSTITVTTPDYDGPSSGRRNYNWVQALAAGCQFICLNYNLGNGSEELRAYVDYFKTYSFIVKPYQMRYKPIRVEPPLEQNPNLSMTSRTINTPDGAITI